MAERIYESGWGVWPNDQEPDVVVGRFTYELNGQQVVDPVLAGASYEAMLDGDDGSKLLEVLPDGSFLFQHFGEAEPVRILPQGISKDGLQVTVVVGIEPTTIDGDFVDEAVVEARYYPAGGAHQPSLWD